MLEGTRRGFGLSQKISDGGGWQIIVSSVCGLQIYMMKGPSGVAKSGEGDPTISESMFTSPLVSVMEVGEKICLPSSQSQSDPESPIESDGESGSKKYAKFKPPYHGYTYRLPTTSSFTCMSAFD